MLVTFSVEILIVTGAVAMLALLDAGSMLGIVFAVHVGTTAIVTGTIVRSMNSSTLAAGRAQAGARPPIDVAMHGPRVGCGGWVIARPQPRWSAQA